MLTIQNFIPEEIINDETLIYSDVSSVKAYFDKTTGDIIMTIAK